MTIQFNRHVPNEVSEMVNEIRTVLSACGSTSSAAVGYPDGRSTLNSRRRRAEISFP